MSLNTSQTFLYVWTTLDILIAAYGLCLGKACHTQEVCDALCGILGNVVHYVTSFVAGSISSGCLNGDEITRKDVSLSSGKTVKSPTLRLM
jgi:hypothetical protein